jgi:hypothetical protein
MIGSDVAHFSIPSSANKSVGLSRKGMGKNGAKRGRAKGKGRRAKGKGQSVKGKGGRGDTKYQRPKR